MAKSKRVAFRLHVVQHCERLHTRLDAAACADRWRRGFVGGNWQKNGNPDSGRDYLPCRGCMVGRANAVRVAAALQQRPQSQRAASA